MKKNSLYELLQWAAAPAVTILCGLVLLFSPDSASALVSQILSIVFLLWGLGYAVMAVFGSENRFNRILFTFALFLASRWLSQNPLGLAAWASRILGIGLLIGGAGGCFLSQRRSAKLLSLGEAVLGIVLIVLPMFASRMVFRICGLVVVVIGVSMLVSRSRLRRLQSGKPKIIDI